MSSEQQVLEGLVAKARLRSKLANEEYKKWFTEVEAARVGQSAYEAALDTYLRDNGNLPSEIANSNGSNPLSESQQQKLQMDIEDRQDTKAEENEENEPPGENDEVKFGKTFVLRDMLYENREKAMNIDDILKALPEYSKIDREFLHKTLPRFVGREELTKDKKGNYHASVNLAKPERRVGRAKIVK